MRTVLLTALLLALLTAACGSDSEESSGKPSISATTGILADITAQVAGEDASIEQVIPEGSSPHDFQLSAEDRASIEDSALLVHNGSDLEQGVPVDAIDIPQFALTDNVGSLRPDDPHVWMDPTRIAAALPALADSMAAADPDHAADYRSRAAAFASELNELDRELAAELEAVPAANRELVTSHDALGYFADRYGFDVIATPFPASGTEAEASAAQIDEVEDAVRKAGVPAVFAEREDDPEVLELVAEDTDVEIVTDLLVESPGDSGGYVEMLRLDAKRISTALEGP